MIIIELIKIQYFIKKNKKKKKSTCINIQIINY